MKMTKLFGTILLACLAMCGLAGFAQAPSSTAPSSAVPSSPGLSSAGPSSAAAAFQNTPDGKIINAWYAAWEKKDWNSLEQVLATGFTFSSPLDDHINVKAVKERCWPNAYNIKRFDVEKFAVNGDEAFVITKGWTTAGKSFRNTDYFRVKDGKIQAYECFFGPGISYPNSGK